MSRPAAELQALLRNKGVGPDSVVVLYGDGGPEPYRLWWTLREMAGYDTRILDGGLRAWKDAGHYVAGGAGIVPKLGVIGFESKGLVPKQHWAQAAAFLAARPKAVLLDTRSAIEFSGQQKHPRAQRAGHIPKAKHLDWTKVLRDSATDHRLLGPTELAQLFTASGIGKKTPVLTYCQSGTRSAAVYFALFQLGHSMTDLHNDDGSWAEYSAVTRLPTAP